MAMSCLQSSPSAADYLSAALKAPVYKVAQVTPLQEMKKSLSGLIIQFWLSVKICN